MEKNFKKLREAYQLSLKELAKEGLSLSQLSRFEHEISDLTVSQFISALDSLNGSIEEFRHTSNEFQRSNSEIRRLK